MKNITYSFFILLLFALVSCNGNSARKAEITTDFGTIVVELYDSTPGHRDNFIKLVKDGFYDDLLFHRVMEGFMIQGGDPNSRGAAPGVSLGTGGPGYQIPHEIGAPHFKGTLAAARTPNPEKKSSGSQFYLVQGTVQTDQMLDAKERQSGFKYNAAQREKYKGIGGTPMLDMDYTVYGEVISGLEVIDKIAAVQTERDRPLEDVKMKIRMLN